MKKNKVMTQISLENTELVLNALETSGEFISLTKGISMRPMLRHCKDVVIITKPTRELKKGDVPLYKRSNYDFLVLHRILEVKEDHYVIRGDNTYSLEHVPKDFVVGVLKEFYRNGKYVNCETSKGYKLYVKFINLIYPLRFVWARCILPILVKIKHLIFK